MANIRRARSYTHPLVVCVPIQYYILEVEDDDVFTFTQYYLQLLNPIVSFPSNNGGCCFQPRANHQLEAV
jgi:hypothetical protein